MKTLNLRNFHSGQECLAVFYDGTNSVEVADFLDLTDLADLPRKITHSVDDGLVLSAHGLQESIPACAWVIVGFYTGLVIGWFTHAELIYLFEIIENENKQNPNINCAQRCAPDGYKDTARHHRNC